MNEIHQATRGRARGALVLVAKIVVSTALLFLLLSRVDTSRFWAYARKASLVWLASALGVYLLQLLVSAWRWQLLLTTQRVTARFRALVSSYLIATFFNNFLPSNIGGDVVRIRDSATLSGSRTVATTVILFDRGIGLMALVLIAALGATVAAATGRALLPWSDWLLWFALLVSLVAVTVAVAWPNAVARALKPLTLIHADWVSGRITGLTAALSRFREEPRSLASCFGGAVVVQALLVCFYVAIVHSMHIPIAAWHLAVIVPLSFIVQMLPVSVNGFGVREATFSVFFHRVGLPIESALVVSFMGAALMMVFSLSGGVAYIGRSWGSHRAKSVAAL